MSPEATRYVFYSKGSRFPQRTGLQLCWEVHGDPISDDFTPEEISARELLALWVERYGEEAEGGLVPISWFIEGDGVFETAPFQHRPWHPEDFLTFYTWPRREGTGLLVNWLTLPVEDKLWRADRADKGGFIQEATGWKPGAYQPFVSLKPLLCCP